MRKFLVCLMLTFTQSCTATPVSECAWVRQIVVADGDSLTRATAEQIVAHNRKVEAFCR